MNLKNIYLETMELVPKAGYPDKSYRGQGVGVKIQVQGKRIARPSEPMKIHCVGYVMTYLWLLFEYFGLEETFPEKEIQELYDWVYILQDSIKGQIGWEGGAVAVLCRNDWATRVYDPYAFEAGTILQRWDYDGEDMFGHSMISTGEYGFKNGRPIVWVYSSNYTTNGVGRDWYYLSHPKKVRVWHACQLKEEFLYQEC